MKKYALFSTSILLVLFAGTFQLQAELRGGRALDGDRSLSARFMLSQFDGVEGNVRETKRAGATEVTTEGRFLETYSFEEVGFDDGFTSFGIELEKHWKYITLQADLQYASLDGRAESRRVYAIGVDHVSFDGKNYDYMLIPPGTDFKSDMDLLILDTKFKFTPFHYDSPHRYLTFSPWFTLGIYAMAADFTIDAGPPSGLTTYEIDPFPYVVGGRGKGTVGGLLPSIGLGGELRIGLSSEEGPKPELVLQGDLTFLDLVARTGDFGVSSRNEKNIDTQFFNLELRAQLEMPISEHTDWLLGLGMKVVSAEADIEADRQAPGEKTTEKYDKSAEVDLQSTFIYTGFKF